MVLTTEGPSRFSSEPDCKSFNRRSFPWTVSFSRPKTDTMGFWKREEAGGDGCELVGEEMATLVGAGVCNFAHTYYDPVHANCE